MAQLITKYPIGLQNFESLRKNGFAYVDKTDMVWTLANEGKYYFLSRPRRFGKSLLISTLEAYFEGKRELFDGLKIMAMEQEWKHYPVLHLDLNAAQYRAVSDLHDMLDIHLRRWEAQYGRDEHINSLPGRFAYVIEQACLQTQMPVAILIDEYDKPLALNLDNTTLANEFRDMLKAFYGVLKSSDRYIRMAILTGVTKFSKVSIFSDLNNLRDISMVPQYVALCGLTEQEIRASFDGGMRQLAASCDMSAEECYDALRRRYDGYHFSENSIGIFNPFSVLNTLASQRFDNYWFETGTPTQLVTLMQQSEFPLSNLTDESVSAELLSSIDSIQTNPVPVLYQSGYLTIRGYNREFMDYQLDFPNEEVRASFIKFLLPYYTNAQRNLSQFAVSHFVNEVRTGQAEAFMTRLSALMADTDYRIVGNSELYFQNFLFTFFRLIGLYVQVERATSNGRSDMIITTSDYIYILEFKIDQSAETALQQIEDKGYARPYAADPRRLFKIGINFDSKTRCVSEWRIA